MVPSFKILIDFTGDKISPVNGQVYLNLVSRWMIYDSPIQQFPNYEEEIPDIPVEEQLRLLCSIREKIIVDVQLGVDWSHLIIHLESGKVFFLNGCDADSECWQLGVAMGEPGESWFVVARPGGDLAVWAPESFNAE